MWGRQCHPHDQSYFYHSPIGHGHLSFTHCYNCSDGYSTIILAGHGHCAIVHRYNRSDVSYGHRSCTNDHLSRAHRYPGIA